MKQSGEDDLREVESDLIDCLLLLIVRLPERVNVLNKVTGFLQAGTERVGRLLCSSLYVIPMFHRLGADVQCARDNRRSYGEWRGGDHRRGQRCVESELRDVRDITRASALERLSRIALRNKVCSAIGGVRCTTGDAEHPQPARGPGHRTYPAEFGRFDLQDVGRGLQLLWIRGCAPDLEQVCLTGGRHIYAGMRFSRLAGRRDGHCRKQYRGTD